MSVISIVTKPDGSCTGSDRWAKCTFGLQLAGDEPDRDDLELLGRVQQPHAGPLAGRLVFEGDLAEADQRIADVGGVVDRQPSPAMRVDVGERTVGKAGSFLRIEAGHARDDTKGVSHESSDRTSEAQVDRHLCRGHGAGKGGAFADDRRIVGELNRRDRVVLPEKVDRLGSGWLKRLPSVQIRMILGSITSSSPSVTLPRLP